MAVVCGLAFLVSGGAFGVAGHATLSRTLILLGALALVLSLDLKEVLKTTKELVIRRRVLSFAAGAVMVVVGTALIYVFESIFLVLPVAVGILLVYASLMRGGAARSTDVTAPTAYPDGGGFGGGDAGC